MDVNVIMDADWNLKTAQSFLCLEQNGGRLSVPVWSGVVMNRGRI
jgi:hypothetical protein